MAEEIKFKSAEDFTYTVKLYSGKEVIVDLMKITDLEFRMLYRGDTDEEERIKIFCKVTDVKPEEYKKLKFPELKQLTDTILKLGLQPAANPT